MKNHLITNGGQFQIDVYLRIFVYTSAYMTLLGKSRLQRSPPKLLEKLSELILNLPYIFYSNLLYNVYNLRLSFNVLV